MADGDESATGAAGEPLEPAAEGPPAATPRPAGVAPRLTRPAVRAGDGARMPVAPSVAREPAEAPPPRAPDLAPEHEPAIEELSVEPPPVAEPRPAPRAPASPDRVGGRTPSPTPRPASAAPSAPRPRAGWLGTGSRRSPIPADAIRPAPALARAPIPHGGGPEKGAPAAPRVLGGAPRTPLPPPTDNVPLARPAPSPHLSPRMTAVFGGIFGLATVTSIVALLIQVVPPKNERALLPGASASGAASAAPVASTQTGPKKRHRVALPSPWRVSELEKDPGIQMRTGTMDRRSFITALDDAKVPKEQTYRILKAFDGVKKFDHCGRKDKFTVALDRSTKRIKAFEYEVSPSEIYQAREDDHGLLVGTKLDMKIADEEVATAFYVGKDVVASYQWAGLEDGILPALDDAFTGRVSSESYEEGAIVKVIITEETALGLFSHYKDVTAAEYRPADPAKKPIRVYSFKGRGYVDDRGRWFGGGWRMPVPGAPVTSRFNPHRMHPVLHKVMPHTGTDFGAPMGAPIYAALHGVIHSIGPLGRCGNAVEIQHPNGILTGYCHMSRFAPGLKVGDKVGTLQLIGYVGKTGSATGPHLHFFAKKNGEFFDALTLHLDGEHDLPASDRPEFEALKAELDKKLDAIPLPEPPPAAPPKPEPSAAPAASEAPSAAPASAAAPAPSAEAATRPASTGNADSSPHTAAAVPTNVPIEDGGIHPGSLQEDDSIDDGDEAQ